MKAIRVEKFGGPEVLQLQEVEPPRAGPGQVLVRVHAVGVNPVDTYIRSGNYGPGNTVPYTPGFDAAGVVEAIGEGAVGVAVGDRVYTAGTQSGAYAAMALCDVGQVHPLPAAIAFEQGACLGVPYATAYFALIIRAGARGGETILVHGATGAVGLAAVQIAVAHGMTVMGSGGTQEGMDQVLAQGAQYVFNHHEPGYREELLGTNCGRGPDVILEMAAHINLAHDLRLVAQNGRIAVIGSRGEVTINPRDMMAKLSHTLGVVLQRATPAQLQEIHGYLVQGLKDKVLRPIVGMELPLEQAARAHELAMDGGSHGKIVLTV